MKLNHKKVATRYSAVIDGYHVQFGWYDSGRAFIAENGKLLKNVRTTSAIHKRLEQQDVR